MNKISRERGRVWKRNVEVVEEVQQRMALLKHFEAMEEEEDKKESTIEKLVQQEVDQ